jgi:hypothetical protein
LLKDQRLETSTGTEDRAQEIRSEGAQFFAAEKSGEGMALIIFTGAKPSQKANIKPFDIMGIESLTSSNQRLTLNQEWINLWVNKRIILG